MEHVMIGGRENFNIQLKVQLKQLWITSVSSQLCDVLLRLLIGFDHYHACLLIRFDHYHVRPLKYKHATAYWSTRLSTNHHMHMRSQSYPSVSGATSKIYK